jgi:NDP-sugar pyrophosphorylase family protein
MPKPLLPIGCFSILELQISWLARYGFDEILIATFCRGNYTKAFIGDSLRFHVTISVSKENKPLGTYGTLTLLEDKLTETFLLKDGDILTNMDFSKIYRHALKINSDIVVAAKEIVIPYGLGTIRSEGGCYPRREISDKGILAGHWSNR